MTLKTFCYNLPVYMLLISGWMVAGYFAYKPSYDMVMAELPPNSVLNVVSPYFYLYLAVTSNVISWVIAASVYYNEVHK